MTSDHVIPEVLFVGSNTLSERLSLTYNVEPSYVTYKGVRPRKKAGPDDARMAMGIAKIANRVSVWFLTQFVNLSIYCAARAPKTPYIVLEGPLQYDQLVIEKAFSCWRQSDYCLQSRRIRAGR